MESLPLPERQSRPEKARAVLEEFIQKPAFDMLAEVWNGTTLPAEPIERLKVLYRIASAPPHLDPSWDIREGRQRHEVDWSEPLLTQKFEQKSGAIRTFEEVIFSAGRELNMVGRRENVINKEPDYLVIPSSVGLAPYFRLKHGLECVDDFKALVSLASERKIGDHERFATDTYAPDAETEFDLGVGSFMSLLDIVEPAPKEEHFYPKGDGRILRMNFYNFRFKGETKAGIVLSTPASPGQQRANTHNNFDSLSAVMDSEEYPGASVLVATSALYTWQQYLPAVEKLTLAYGSPVEVVGYDDGPVKPLQILQEIKASIDAAMHLYEAIELHSITH